MIPVSDDGFTARIRFAVASKKLGMVILVFNRTKVKKVDIKQNGEVL